MEKEESSSSDDEVDYGRAADMFASRSDDEESVSGEEEQPADARNDNDSEEDDDSSDDDDVEEDEGDVTAVFKGVDLPGDDDDDDDDEDMDSAEEADAPVKNWNKQTGDENCTFDLRNLLSVNTHPIAPKSLYSSKKKDKAGNDRLTIPLDPGHGVDVDESFLLSKASEDCTQLIAGLWKLPTDRSDAGPMVHLPAHDEIKLPRALVSGLHFLLCSVKMKRTTFGRFSHSLIDTFFLPPYHHHHCRCCSYTATTASQKGDKMGKICQRKGHFTQQGKAVTKSLGRSYWRMEAPTWI